MNQRILPAFSLVLLLSASSGCGYKGPLYLPVEAKAPKPAKAAEMTAIPAASAPAAASQTAVEPTVQVQP